MNLTRRSFFRTLAAAAMALVALPRSVAWAKTKKLAIPLAKAEKLKAVGGWAVLKVKDMEILFMRDSETTVKACDAKCTHQQCPVKYNPEKKRIDCTCHGSAFEFNGKVVNGPATKDIKVYNATLDGDRIIVEVEEAD